MSARLIFLLFQLSQTRYASSLSAPSAPPSSPPVTSEVVRSYSLFEPAQGGGGRKCIGRCREVTPPPKDPDEEEDEVELWYSTSHRSFLFPCRGCNGSDDEGVDRGDDDDDGGWERNAVRVSVRQTSFGCGRLGATLWPSGIGLACYLSGENAWRSLEGKRVLELGSGCGLPSVVARDACGASDVLATDFWEEEGGGNFDGDRLVPKNLFGINLEHNLGVGGGRSFVQRLDWHDKLGVIGAASHYKPDVIIGSDIVYYPMDVTPLLDTLNILFRSGAKEAILFCPLPKAEREALPEFRTRLGRGELEECSIGIEEVEMDVDDEMEAHRFLKITIANKREGLAKECS